MQVNITIDDSQVRRMLGNMSKNFEKLGDKVCEHAVNIEREEMVKQLQFHRFSGYASSNKGLQVHKMKNAVWQLSMPYYLKYLNEGAKPHWVNPNTAEGGAKLTRWMWTHGNKGIMTGGLVKIATKKTGVIDKAHMSAVKRIREEAIKGDLDKFLKNEGRVAG